MLNPSIRVILVISMVLAMLGSACVSRADVTGSILGRVKDRSEGSVVGSKIVATNVETNLTHETVSGSDGSFSILALSVGTYKLTVTTTGFRPFTETDIVVRVNDKLRVDVTLDVGTMTEQVEVMANDVQVQTESTQLGLACTSIWRSWTKEFISFLRKMSICFLPSGFWTSRRIRSGGSPVLKDPLPLPMD